MTGSIIQGYFFLIKQCYYCANMRHNGQFDPLPILLELTTRIEGRINEERMDRKHGRKSCCCDEEGEIRKYKGGCEMGDISFHSISIVFLNIVACLGSAEFDFLCKKLLL